MPSDTITFEIFETLVARHGTDPARWPDPALAADPQIAAWLAEERAWERDLGVGAPLSANFADRVVAATTPARRATWWSGRRGAAVAAAFAAMVGVGVVAPGLLPGAESDPAEEAWAELATDAGFGDLYAWVEG